VVERIETARERREVLPIPEIPDDAWGMDVHNGEAEIHFDTIRNTGSGPAIRMLAWMRVGYADTAAARLAPHLQDVEQLSHHVHGSFEGTVVGAVPPGDERRVRFIGRFPWPPEDEQNDGLFVSIDLYAWDIENRRYLTTYVLFAEHQAWTGGAGTQLTGPTLDRDRLEAGEFVLVPSTGPRYGLRRLGMSGPVRSEGPIDQRTLMDQPAKTKRIGKFEPGWQQ
jgi:hypothetical protein